jgi:protein SCO1/2
MTKKAIFALMLAILMPLAGYFIVKYYSKEAVHMPGRYFVPDSVVVSEKNGKTVTDTIWHKVRNIEFTNQLGKKVSLDDLKRKVLVIDFFFTRCPSICPGLARSMKRLQDSFVKNDSIVQFISISVDPAHDSVPQLRKFADRFNANHDTWWFVTGDKKEIYDFAFNELKASVTDSEIDTAFLHTENFFLLDSNRIVRGWYNGFDTVKQAQLVRDIPLLMLEKDKRSPSVFREFIPILPIIFVAIGIVFIAVFIFNRQKTKQEKQS